MDRKTIARFLDRAADRADAAGARPASSKQNWYLAGLIAGSTDERDVEWATQPSLILTIREASNMIDAFVNNPFANKAA